MFNKKKLVGYLPITLAKILELKSDTGSNAPVNKRSWMNVYISFGNI